MCYSKLMNHINIHPGQIPSVFAITSAYFIYLHTAQKKTLVTTLSFSDVVLNKTLDISHSTYTAKLKREIYFIKTFYLQLKLIIVSYFFQKHSLPKKSLRKLGGKVLNVLDKVSTKVTPLL